MRKKTIIHVINSLPIGGAEILLKQTLPLLEEYDHVVCYLNAPDTLAKDFSPWPVICLHHRSKTDVIHTLVSLRKIIKKHDAAIVHAHLLESTLLCRLACPRGVKLVFSIHSILSYDAFTVNKLSLWAERLSVSSKQYLIAVSHTVLKDYLNWVPFKGKAWTLYNFVSDRFFEAKPMNAYYKGASDRLRIVAVGNLKSAKNYIYMLDAFKQLKHLPVDLDIYGSGEQKDFLQKVIDEHKLSVTLKGGVSDTGQVLPSYDLYLTSSLHEGYGIAPLEGMAAGIPVLASDIAVFREVLGDTALYFDLNDPISLAALIQSLLSKSIDMEVWSLRSKKWAMDVASKKKYQSSLKSIYQQILTGS